MTIAAETIQQAIQAWVVHGSQLDNGAVIFAGQGGRPPRAGTNELYDEWIVIAFPSIRRHGQDWTSTELAPLVFADKAFDPDPGNDTLEIVGHTLTTGTGPVRLETSDTLPSNLEVGRDYWVIRGDDDHVRLAATFLDAMNGVSVAFDDAGAGAHTLVDQPTTVAQGSEVRYHSRGMRTFLVQLTCFSYEPLGQFAAHHLLERVISSMSLPTARSLFDNANIGEGVIGDITTVGGSIGGAATNLEPRAIAEIWFHTSSDVSELGTFIERVSGSGTLDDEETPFVIP